MMEFSVVKKVAPLGNCAVWSHSCKPRGACLLILELWDEGLCFPLSKLKVLYGKLWRGVPLSLPLLAPSLIILCPLQERRFSDQELGHVTQRVCLPPNPRAVPEDCSASLSELFWAFLRAHGTEYMRPAGFYKARAGVMIMLTGPCLEKMVKKMNVGDLCGMTLEG